MALILLESGVDNLLLLETDTGSEIDPERLLLEDTGAEWISQHPSDEAWVTQPLPEPKP